MSSRIRYRVEPDRTGFLRAVRLSIVREHRATALVRDGLGRRTLRVADLHPTRTAAWAAWRQDVGSTLAALREDHQRIGGEITRIEELLGEHENKAKPKREQA